jgi:GntR family transcriptional regulator, rspAB operon transcriptional repressor
MLHAAFDMEDRMSVSRGPTLGEQVYAYIRQRIITGYYRPGQIIVESELAHALNVSRTPVSNAVIMLKERGLIEERNGKFATLDLTLGDVMDLYQCRLAFDGLAAQLAATRITRDQVDTLAGLLDVWDQPGGEMGSQRLWEADLAFHALVYEASANRHLIHFSEVASDLLSTYRRVIVENLSDRVSTRNRSSVRNEHAAVVDALAAGDPVLAEEAARAHISNVITFLEGVRSLVTPALDFSASRSPGPA